MQILAISDEVLKKLYQTNVKRNYPDVKLLIGCGDLPYYYMDFLVTAFGKPLFYVRGNHDDGEQWDQARGLLTDVRGGTNIHGQSVLWNGLLLAGLEGSVRYKPNAQCMFTQNEMKWEAIKLGWQLMWNKQRHGRAIDILITHAPPQGIHDKEDLPHHGFAAFLDVIRIYKPRYLLHGHIHRYHSLKPQITQYHETTVINVYPSYLLDYAVDTGEK